MTYKLPRSVQVVVFARGTNGIRYLLLRRAQNYGGFWQTLTGSLEADETHIQAAIRELAEETGLVMSTDQLIDLGLTNTFEIAPQWRGRYAPGVTHNEEVCFAIVTDEAEIRIDSSEHEAWRWVDYDTALEMLYWDSSKRALNATRALLDSSPGVEE